MFSYTNLERRENSENVRTSILLVPCSSNVSYVTEFTCFCFLAIRLVVYNVGIVAMEDDTISACVNPKVEHVKINGELTTGASTIWI